MLDVQEQCPLPSPSLQRLLSCSEEWWRCDTVRETSSVCEITFELPLSTKHGCQEQLDHQAPVIQGQSLLLPSFDVCLLPHEELLMSGIFLMVAVSSKKMVACLWPVAPQHPHSAFPLPKKKNKSTETASEHQPLQQNTPGHWRTVFILALKTFQQHSFSATTGPTPARALRFFHAEGKQPPCFQHSDTPHLSIQHRTHPPTEPAATKTPP